MFGKGSGWGVGFLPRIVGTNSRRPDGKAGVVEGRSSFVNISILPSFDNDIVDGAPAARFAQSLKGLIESGYGLEVNK
jgi:pyruvate/2-oxoglutarate dehydrogenase complex dihydrolipoamide acyltransferase (E2) component